MLFRIFFLVAILFCSNIFAQQKNIDSLQELLTKDVKPDTTRLKRLGLLSWAYRLVDPRKGIEIADQGILLARKMGDSSSYLMNLYNFKGANYWTAGESLLAEKMFTIAGDLASLNKNVEGKMHVLNNLSILLLESGKLDEASKNYDELLQLAREIKDQKKEAEYLMNLGLVMLYKSDFVKALDYFFQAEKIINQKGYKNIEPNLYTNIGVSYSQMMQEEKAMIYFEKSLSVSLELKNKIGIVTSYFQLATILRKKKDYTKALQYLDEAKRHAGSDSLRGVPQIYTEAGIVYTEQNKFQDALSNLTVGIAMLRENANFPDLSFALANLANLYLQVPNVFLAENGLSPVYRNKRVKELLDESIGLAQKTQMPAFEKDALQYLSDYYEMQGDYRQALVSARKAALISDSIYKDENKLTVGYLEAQFENEKINSVLKATHETELKYQRTIKNYLLIGGTVLVFIAVLFFFSYKRRSEAQAKRKGAELKAQISDTEMKVMRLQMNPHFIFNSLNSISDYIQKNNPQEADIYLSKFAKVMRMTLENSEQKVVSLDEDLTMLDLYMQLEAKRMNNKFSYEIRIGDDIDRDNTMVPPMILQPFVENSIWHGIAQKEGPGKIVISISKKGEMLHCLIDDDGLGRKPADPRLKSTEKKRESMGMKITKARIDILNRLKGSNATVQLIDKPDGTGVQAEVDLPLEIVS